LFSASLAPPVIISRTASTGRLQLWVWHRR
jgi:hypothetical protein